MPLPLPKLSAEPPQPFQARGPASPLNQRPSGSRAACESAPCRSGAVRPEREHPTTQTPRSAAASSSRVRGAGPATAPQECPPRPASSKHRVLHILLLTPRPNLFRTPKLVSVRGMQAVHPPEPPGSVVIVREAPTFHSRSPSPLLSGETTTFGA